MPDAVSRAGDASTLVCCCPENVALVSTMPVLPASSDVASVFALVVAVIVMASADVLF